MLEGLCRRIAQITKPGEPSLPIVGTPREQDLWLLPLQRNEWNLNLARENGIKPLSFENIIGQIGLEKVGNIVLFDTPSVRGFVGNHWRIIKIDEEEERVILQVCNPFGNYDDKGQPPVDIPLGRITFTGFSIQKFELDGRPVTLNKVVSTNTESLEHVDETIYWSNREGKLKKVTMDTHESRA